MNQFKVTNTQQYSDSEDEHIVHEGKLVLIEPKGELLLDATLWKNKETNKVFRNPFDSPIQLQIDNTPLQPIIISETEEVSHQDFVLYKSIKYRVVQTDVYNLKLENGQIVERSKCQKVLALPEHFSNKHLQDIVDGELGDGDKVLIKCVSIANVVDHPLGPLMEYNEVIDVDDQNRITLFPAKQSLEEAAKEHGMNTQIGWHQKIAEKSFKAGAEWAKKNNY